MNYFLSGVAIGMIVLAFIAHKWERQRREKEMNDASC